MKKVLVMIALLAMMVIASSEPNPTIRFTVVNKSGMDIAVQLRNPGRVCMNCADSTDPKFYYLPVLSGDREMPNAKNFFIEKETYQMQVFFIETWDPVYGFECDTTIPAVLQAARNIRLTILPCEATFRKLGEGGMWKFMPYMAEGYFKRIWYKRFIY
ncbi:MAG: hypothetical protein ACKOC5_06675 [Chloroflexota bacterium]